MASTVWKGHLTFGLVSIPVRLFRAARAEKVNLRQLYRPKNTQTEPDAAHFRPPTVGQAIPPAADLQPAIAEHLPESDPAPVARVHQTAVEPDTNAPIERRDLLRGYEYEKDRYVVIPEEELHAITPRTATEMPIVEFVCFSEIDPVYLETSYYMAPEEAGEKAYALLFEGMRESGYAAIAQVAMHRREHVMILRPGRKGIVAHTMFYPDEVRSDLEFRTDTALVTPRELGLARMLIDTLAARFEPEKFKDSYRERLRQLIESKAGGGAVAPAAPAPAAKVVDIMEALQKSLEAAHQKTASKEEEKPRKPAKPEKLASKKRRRTSG